MKRSSGTLALISFALCLPVLAQDTAKPLTLRGSTGQCRRSSHQHSWSL